MVKRSFTQMLNEKSGVFGRTIEMETRSSDSHCCDDFFNDALPCFECPICKCKFLRFKEFNNVVESDYDLKSYDGIRSNDS